MKLTTHQIENVTFFFLFRWFKTEARAKMVWEKIEREAASGDVSVVRFRDSVGHENCVAMISEREEGLEKYAHLLENEGTGYEPRETILEALALRRAEHVMKGESTVIRHGRDVPMRRDGKLDFGPHRN